MKKTQNQNQKKLSLNKLRIAKINNPQIIKGGDADANIPIVTAPTKKTNS